MLDRVREALFSTLGPGIADSHVLDLFAGSGSLGLEAISRGAAFARLVEFDRQVITTLTANVDALGLSTSVEVFRGDALAPRSSAPPADQPERWVDLVLFDPPYPWLQDDRRQRLLDRIDTLLRNAHWSLCGHKDSSTKVLFPWFLGSFCNGKAIKFPNPPFCSLYRLRGRFQPGVLLARDRIPEKFSFPRAVDRALLLVHP